VAVPPEGERELADSDLVQDGAAMMRRTATATTVRRPMSTTAS
jgi:hypothetical protein